MSSTSEREKEEEEENKKPKKKQTLQKKKSCTAQHLVILVGNRHEKRAVEFRVLQLLRHIGEELSVRPSLSHDVLALKHELEGQEGLSTSGTGWAQLCGVHILQSIESFACAAEQIGEEGVRGCFFQVCVCVSEVRDVSFKCVCQKCVMFLSSVCVRSA